VLHWLATPFYVLGGVDPTEIRTCETGERCGAFFLGCQVLLGGSLTFVGVYATINATLGDTGSRAFWVSLLVAAIMALIDSQLLRSSWFSLGQILAQKRGYHVPDGATQGRRILSGSPRMLGATFACIFFGMIITLILLRPDINRQQVIEQHAANLPIEIQITADVDKDISAKEQRYNEAQKALNKELQAESESNKPDTVAIDRDLTSALGILETQRKKHDEVQDAMFAAKFINNCETNSGIGCTGNSIGKKGDGDLSKKAARDADINHEQLNALEGQISNTESHIKTLQEQRTAIIQDFQDKVAAKAVIMQERTNAARDVVRQTLNAWQQAHDDRETTIANRMRANLHFAEKSTGFVADMMAVEGLTAKSWTMWLWVLALKFVIVMLEASSIWLHLFSLTPSEYAFRLSIRFEMMASQMLNEVRIANVALEKEVLKAEKETIDLRNQIELRRKWGGIIRDNDDNTRKGQ
jgi:hypothetical protein